MSRDTGSSASSRLIEGEVSGDTVPRFALLASGQLEFGSGAATRDAVLYRSAADTLKTDDSLTVAGTMLVDSAGTAINAVDRGATTNFAAYVLRTAGTDEWSLQMVSDETNDVQLTNSARGLVALLVEDRATALNLSLLTDTKSYGGGVGVIFLANAGTVPASNPTGGGILYAEAGALKWRGSSGTVTELAPA